MDIRSWCWCSSGRRSIQLGSRYQKLELSESFAEPRTRSSKQNWKRLWRKFLKERKKMFQSPSMRVVQVPYDAYTYSQNFDKGSNLDEPDDLSKSFSVRFAVADPSRIILK